MIAGAEQLDDLGGNVHASGGVDAGSKPEGDVEAGEGPGGRIKLGRGEQCAQT